jgi:hypothetical protein
VVTACTRTAGFERLLARSPSRVDRTSGPAGPVFCARPSNEPHRISAHQRLYGSPVGVRSGRGVIAGAR